jgi:presequence protease
MHEAFVPDHHTPLPRLGLDWQAYRHSSGAMHVHLACDDPHRVCLIGFRTPANDGRGLPHILEHCVLSGSERFPVRDPFFHMLKRSLQTFMNAFTGPDTTCYPFASTNAIDFGNLLDIYLDAVFHPLLRSEDVAQEGCRLAADEVGRVRWDGVVYNEMLGATAEPDEQLYQGLLQHLLPETGYIHNAGGEPALMQMIDANILRQYHQQHYQAGNCCLISYGAIDPAWLQERFLTAKPAAGPACAPSPLQTPWISPRRARIALPTADHHQASPLLLAWLGPDLREVSTALEGALLEELLFGHVGAPLRQRLERSGLCSSVDGSGLLGHLRQAGFLVEAKDVQQPDVLEQCCLDTLSQLGQQGFNAEAIATACHQLSLSLRRIPGDRQPYGLSLAERVFHAWSIGADPLPHLDPSAEMDAISRAWQDPGQAQACLRQWLLDNPHRLSLRGEAEPELSERLRTGRQAACDAVNDIASLQAQERSLAAHQADNGDPTCLPQLGRDQIPRQRYWPSGSCEGPIHRYAVPSAGLLHAVFSTRLAIDTTRETLLPLWSALCGDLAVGDHDDASWAARVHACSAGIHASQQWCDNGVLVCLDIWGLAERGPEFLPLIAELLQGQRFDDVNRVVEILREEFRLQQDDVLHRASALALDAAGSTLQGPAGRAHQRSGLGHLLSLHDLLQSDSQRLSADLATLQRQLLTAPWQLALIGDMPATMPAALAPLLQEQPDPTTTSVQAPALTGSADYAGVLPAQVAGNALVLAAPRLGHPDAGALYLAAQYLSHGPLHHHLRERGGAYGGGAGYRAGSGLFACTSYRDPHLDVSFTIMQEAITELAQSGLARQALDEARLTAIAALDRPASPLTEAREYHLGERSGRSSERIDTLRAQVLACDTRQLQRAVAEHLCGPASRGTVCPPHLLASSHLPWQRQDIPTGLP